MSVDVIIPNYNGSNLIEKNLPKVIESHSGYKGKIIIVDDGSNIFDKQRLREFVENLNDKKVELVEHVSNKGFASAINTGVWKSTADFVVLLNSDVVPYPNFLRPLIERMKTNDLMFGVGACDKSFESGKFVRRGRGVGYWKGGMVHHAKGDINKKDTFWISGGSCIIRRELFKYLGGMDEIYNPFYWEDIDLSFRARKSGYLIEFCSDSIVEHYHAEGAIKKGFEKKNITTIAYRNQFIFVWKNITSLHLILNHIINIPLMLLKAVKGGEYPMIMGLFLALVKLPAIMKIRKRQGKLFKISDVFLLQNIS